MFKKIFASFLIVAALLVVGGQTNQVEASWYARVAYCNEWISLWADASYDSRRLTTIPLGAVILVTDDYDDGEFVSVRYNGVYGYVLEKYLEDAEK